MIPNNEINGTNMLVLCGVSGAGKGTSISLLQQRCDGNAHFSISMTTRLPRPGEIDGVHYYFRSITHFKHLITCGSFLEYAEVYGNYYGTPKQPIQDAINDRRLVILDVDVVGAKAIRSHAPHACFVFLWLPEAAQRARLVARGDDPASIAQRVSCNNMEYGAFTAAFGRTSVINVMPNGNAASPDRVLDAICARIDYTMQHASVPWTFSWDR